MMKPSATKTAFVIAVLATPALAGGKAPLNLKPVAPAAKAKIGLGAVKPDKASAPATVDELKPDAPKAETYDLGKVSLGESYDVLKPGRRSALPGEAEM